MVWQLQRLTVHTNCVLSLVPFTTLSGAALAAPHTKIHRTESRQLYETRHYRGITEVRSRLDSLARNFLFSFSSRRLKSPVCSYGIIFHRHRVEQFPLQIKRNRRIKYFRMQKDIYLFILVCSCIRRRILSNIVVIISLFRNVFML